MGRYYQRSDAPDVTVTATTNGWNLYAAYRALADATATAGTASVTVTANTSNFRSFMFVSPASAAGVINWPAGAGDTYAVQVSVNTSPASLSHVVGFGRLSSDGATQLAHSGFQSGQSFSGTGLKSVSIDGTLFTGLNDNAGRSATDRYFFYVLSTNSDMMNALGFTLNVNVSDSYADVPWDVGGAPPAADVADPFGMSGFFGA